MYPQQAEKGKDIRQVARVRHPKHPTAYSYRILPGSRRISYPHRQPQVQHIPRPSVPSLPRQAFSRSTCSVVVQTSPVQPISPSAQFPTARFQTLRRHVKPSSNRTGPGLQRILPQTGLGWNRKVVLPSSKQGKPPPEGYLSNDWAGRPKLGGQGAMLHLEPATAESVASCYSVSLLRPFCPCLPLTRAC